MTEELTREDIEDIFDAIGIVESESGGNYEELKSKLYSFYPSVKKAHDDAEKKRQEATEKWARLRKNITNSCIKSLDVTQPLVPQIVEFYLKDEEDIGNHGSDNICLPADIYKYHGNDIVRPGESISSILEKELKKMFRDAGTSYWELKSRDEMWHGLVRVLECRKYGLELNR